MNPSTPSQTRRFRWERWALGGLVLLFGLVASVALYRDRARLGAQEAERLEAQARVVDENLTRQIEGANNALAGIRDELENLGLPGSNAAIADRLKLLSDSMPGVRTLVVLDARGVVVSSSRPELLGTNSSKRDFFDTPRRQPKRDVLYVSAPFKSPLGPLVVGLGRVLTDAKGDFAGVVVATLDPAYFEVALRSVLYAPDMRTWLVHGDGQLFVNVPSNQAALGMSLAQPGSLFMQHQLGGHNSSLVTGRSSTTGDDRMMALRTLDRADLRMDKPIVGMVSREVAAIYAPWRERALSLAVFYAIVVLGAATGLHFSQQRRKLLHRIQEEAARDRQQSAERLELALRGADLGLWDLHVPSETFVINARERALLGFSADDALPQGPAWRDLIHPDDRALVFAATLPTLQGETDAYDCEHRMRHKEGHYRWLLSRAVIVQRDADGRPERIVGTHLDITDRRNAELQLRLSERRLKAVNDNVPAIVAHLDPDCRYLTANEGFRRTFGIDPATMLGRTLREVRGEAVFALMEPRLRAVLQGETSRFEITDTIAGVRHHFQHSLIPDFDELGVVQGFYSVAFDITELRRSEELLVESSARHRAIVEEQSELVSLARRSGELVYVNRAHAKHFGRPAAELVGKSLFDLVVPDDREMARSVVADVFATGSSRSGDSRVFAADRAECWVAWTNTLQRDSDGDVLLRSVGRDITEQRRAERALRSSQRFLARTGRVAGVGGWELDLQGGKLTWSEEIRRIHEVADDYLPTPETAIGFYAPEARPIIGTAVERGIVAGESFDLELRLVTATGRSVWVRTVGDVESVDGRAVRLVGAFQDITGRKLAEQAAEHQKRLLQAVTDNLPVFVMYTDSQRTVRFLNVTAEKWLGRPAEGLIGLHVSAVLGPVAHDAERHVDRALAGESLKFEVQGNPSGWAREMEQHYIPDVGADGSVRGVFAMIHDITEAKEIQRRLDELARVDTLTGLPNRRQFDEKLGEALRRSRRTLRHVAVMFLDIDHFKAINDSLGHAGGDAVLKEFGARLKASVRDTDLAARLAGDEFVVLLEGLTLTDDAAAVAQKVVEAIRADFEVDGSAVRVTTSLGIGFCGDMTATAADLLACADRALYQAKKEGRDGFRISHFGISPPVPALALH